MAGLVQAIPELKKILEHYTPEDEPERYVEIEIQIASIYFDLATVDSSPRMERRTNMNIAIEHQTLALGVASELEKRSSMLLFLGIMYQQCPNFRKDEHAKTNARLIVLYNECAEIFDKLIKSMEETNTASISSRKLSECLYSSAEAHQILAQQYGPLYDGDKQDSAALLSIQHAEKSLSLMSKFSNENSDTRMFESTSLVQPLLMHELLGSAYMCEERVGLVECM